MIFLVFWVACMIGAGVMAKRKDRSVGGWVTIALVIGPLAPIALMFASDRSHDHELTSDRRLADGDIVQGIGAQIEVRPESVAIRRKGASSFILHGMKGEKRIAYESISAVQFKVPGNISSGYIQLSMLGGSESRAGIMSATKDENSVMFERKQLPDFLALRDLVQERASAARRPALAASPSMVDELGKFADLHSRGLLTNAEFEAQKSRLLEAAQPSRLAES